MGFNLGMVKAGLTGMGGNVIQSARRSAMRTMVVKAAMRDADPAIRAAARGMVRGAAIRGGLQGMAVMGGLNAGRQMAANMWNGDSATSGVGKAAFRGAVLGGVGGVAVGVNRAFMSRSSGAWRGFLKNKAISPHVPAIAREMQTVRRTIASMEAEKAAARAARVATRAAAGG